MKSSLRRYVEVGISHVPNMMCVCANLLYVFDVDQFDDFVPLGGSRSGAGALETQITEEMEEICLTLIYKVTETGSVFLFLIPKGGMAQSIRD